MLDVFKGRYCLVGNLFGCSYVLIYTFLPKGRLVLVLRPQFVVLPLAPLVARLVSVPALHRRLAQARPLARPIPDEVLGVYP